MSNNRWLRKFIAVVVATLLSGCLSNRELASSSKHSDYCPAFGYIPKDRTDVRLYEVPNAESKVYIKNYQSKVAEVRKRWVHYFSEYVDKDSFWSDPEVSSENLRFLELYGRICDGFPTYLLRTRGYESAEKVIEEAAEELPDLRRNIEEFSNDRMELLVELNKLPSEQDVDVPLYLIAGSVAMQEDSLVAVNGSAVKSAGPSIEGNPGFAANTTIFVENPRQGDIIAHRYFKGDTYVYLGVRNGYPVYGTKGNGYSEEEVKRAAKIKETNSRRSELQDEIEEAESRCNRALEDVEKLRESIPSICQRAGSNVPNGPFSEECAELLPMLKAELSCN